MKSLLLLSLTLLPMPTWAATKLDTPIEITPCTVITLPDGIKACEPPKVSQVTIPGCIWVTIRKGGKEEKVLVCTQPRPPKPPSIPRTPKPTGGY